MTATAQAGVRYALAMLFLINFLNFFDRAIPAVVLEPIRKEFNLDDTWLGLLGTSFTLIYGLGWEVQIPPYELNGNQPMVVDRDGNSFTSADYLALRQKAARHRCRATAAGLRTGGPEK